MPEGLCHAVFYAYIIRGIPFPKQRYVGYISDLRQCIEAHNYGQDKHTAPYKPWKLEAYIALDSEEKARAFERYLKSGSGHAFASRHF